MTETIAGISIGERGQPRIPVVNALAHLYGVTVEVETVKSWREGESTGSTTQERILARKELKANRAPLKDHAYLRIAEASIKSRRLKVDPYLRERGCYSSANFIGEASARAEVEPRTFQRITQAIRAEIILDSNHLNAGRKSQFVVLGQNYLKAHTLAGASQDIDRFKRFSDQWDETIPNFYRLLYANFVETGARFIGTWAPYEVSFWQDFYKDRIILRSYPLSTFDVLVLANYAEGENLMNLSNRIKDDTKVVVDRHTLTVHRNYLLYGKPLSPIYGETRIK